MLYSQHNVSDLVNKFSMQHFRKLIKISVIFSVFSLVLSSCTQTVHAEQKTIDLSIISIIESSNNPLAFNKSANARGLYQITPVCLKEYNNFNKVRYTEAQLFDPVISHQIADWYYNKRIPAMLKHYGVDDTIKNRIIAYNAGISYVIPLRLGSKSKSNRIKVLPNETVRYIEKYNKLTKKGDK